MAKKLTSLFQYIFFLGLGIFLIWWSLRSLTGEDKLQISQALEKARYGYVAPAIATLLFSHWLRAVRWRLIMEPLGYKPSSLNTFFAVMVGYLANQAVPRLGEVLRCSTLTRYEKIPLDKLLGTVILERLVDAVCLLLVFGAALLLQPSLYENIMIAFFGRNAGTQSTGIFWYLVAGLAIAGTAMVVWVLYNRKKNPERVGWLQKIVVHVWQGFMAIKSLKRPGTFIVLSVMIWILYAASVYIGFLMLEETSHYAMKEALTVLSAGSLAMVATPGGIGAYAFLVQKTMELYQLNSGLGLALGWLLWFPQVAAVIVAGGLSLLALPLYNRKKSTTTS